MERALSYRITDPDTIYYINMLQIKEANYLTPRAYVDEDFINRPAFLEGRYTENVDLSICALIENNENGSGTNENV